MVDQGDRRNRARHFGNSIPVLLAVCIVTGFLGALWKPELSLPFFVLVAGCTISIIAYYRSAAKIADNSSGLMRRNDLSRTDATIYIPMAEAMQHPAYIIDQRAIVQYSNKSASETFGPVGENKWLFGKFRQPALRRVIEEGIRTGSAVKTDYNDPVPKDRWFSIELAPVPADSEYTVGKGVLFLLSFHDLTEAKRIDRMRADFIANASHELRTPLASLSGFLETIKGPARKDREAIDRFTDIMLDQAQRMTRLVNDLLSLSRIEMKAHMRPSSSVDLKEVLTSVVVSLEALSKQFGVKIKLKCKDDIQVIGERDELLQVFENLVENACKYGQGGKRVEISVETVDPKLVEISVQDFGQGIPKEHQHRITERFYRVDVESSREKQGTGLGLAIVKHILNRHGTRLRVESAPGKGAKFIVGLPVVTNVNNH